MTDEAQALVTRLSDAFLRQTVKELIEAKTLIEQLQRERDALAEALREIHKGVFRGTATKIAREVLARVYGDAAADK